MNKHIIYLSIYSNFRSWGPFWIYHGCGCNGWCLL